MLNFILDLINKPVGGLCLLIAPTLILAYIANRYIKTIPWAIWALIFGVLFSEIELIEKIKVNHIVTDDLLAVGTWMIAIAMIQIGLEASDFSFLKNMKFWTLILLIILIPSLIGYLALSLIGTELIGVIALLFTSSLAVVAVFINEKPELFDHKLIKTIMITGIATDITLWIVIGILDISVKNNGIITFNDILPKIYVITIAILSIVTGIKYWWKKVYIEPIVWLLISSIIGVIFYSVGFNPLLGTIFGGLMVPMKDKHHVSDKLEPFFKFSMLIYMGTVGFKLHNSINMEALYYAIAIIVITTIGKYFAIRFSGLIPRENLNQTTMFLGNPGTMGIAASAVMAHEGIIRESLFMAMVIVAIFYTILAGIFFKKYPLEIKENLEDEQNVKIIELNFNES
jgi:hypothetical protein